MERKTTSNLTHAQEGVCSFTVPQGQLSSLMGMMNLLQRDFSTLQIELTATDGEMSEQDYEDKIKEALDQLGIDAVEE